MSLECMCAYCARVLVRAICIATIFAPHHIVHTFDPLLFDAKLVFVFVIHIQRSPDCMLIPDTLIVRI